MIYISGKITDVDPDVQKKNLERFYEVEKTLGRCYNPAKNGDGGDKPYEWYLAKDVIYIIRNRPAMYMLKGWEESRGARLEYEIARQLGLRIDFE